MAAIDRFIAEISANEPADRTLIYRSLQHRENPSRFTHYMVFANESAHVAQRESVYLREFVAALYPCCIADPMPIYVSRYRERTQRFRVPRRGNAATSSAV